MKNKNLMKKSKAITVLVWCIFVILIVYSISLFIPIIWGIITSLKSNVDFSTPGNNVLGFPNLDEGIKWNSREQFFRLENYKLILESFSFHVSYSYYFGNILVWHEADPTIITMTINTILYAGIGAFLRTFTPALMAYACAKYRFKFSDVIYTVVIVVMSIPVIGTDAAKIDLLCNLGLFDTFIGMWLQYIDFTGMYFLMFYAFFRGLSNSFSEAAEVDGASQMSIMLRIILPMASKIITTIMLIMFVSLWNNYQTPILYLPTSPTLAYGVFYLSNNLGGNRELGHIPVRIASCIMLMVPILIMFLIFRDKLMGNVSMGGIKE